MGQAVSCKRLCGGLHSRVGAFREDHTHRGGAGPLPESLQETHVANFRRSASATTGWTKASTSPPNRATSRTRLELR